MDIFKIITQKFTTILSLSFHQNQRWWMPCRMYITSFPGICLTGTGNETGNVVTLVGKHSRHFENGDRSFVRVFPRLLEPKLAEIKFQVCQMFLVDLLN